MKIARFKRLGEHSYETIDSDLLDGLENYVRLTEYVDVEFPMLSEESVIQKQVDALDRTEQALRESFETKLNAIKDERAKLLALAFHPVNA
jgi:hypothetical protein